MIQLSWILVQLFAPSAFEDKVIKIWLNLFDCVDVDKSIYSENLRMSASLPPLVEPQNKSTWLQRTVTKFK